MLLFDMINFGFGIYGLIVYCLNFKEMFTQLNNDQLVKYVVPALAAVSSLSFFRMLAFILFFIVTPRKVMNHLNEASMLNKAHKFPILTLKSYLT